MALAHRARRPAAVTAVAPRRPGDPVHELGAALAGAREGLGREVLAAAVQELEELARCPLGDVDRDPSVLLQRRATRALRLLRRAGPAEHADHLRALAADLRDPCAALLRSAAADPPTVRPATTSLEG